MTDLLLSIIVPMYNAVEYIENCLDSITEYTGNDIEIIVVDDGSEDNSIQKVLSIQDKRIHLFSQKNMGPGAARNTGIHHTRGKFVTFVDSDDWMENGSIGKLIRFINSSDVDTLIFNMYVYYSVENKVKGILPMPDGYSYTPYEREELEKALLGSFNLNSPCAKVYSMKIIKKYQILFPEAIHYGEDSIFNIKYFKYSECGKCINEFVYDYRYNQNSLEQKFSFKKFDDMTQVYKAKTSYYNSPLSSNPNKKVLKKQIDENFIRCLYLNIISAKRNHVKNHQISEYIKSNNITDLIKNESCLSFSMKIRAFFVRYKLYHIIVLISNICRVKYIMRQLK